MKPDIKEAWLTALRSGDYQQGQRHLRQGDQYCCLGVLCDLYGKAAGAEWEEDRQYDARAVHSMCRHETTLPLEVQDWAGTPGMPNPLDLAALNDDGHTFEELADIIEAKL